MVGAADDGYVLKCGDTQYRTIADRKFWGVEQEQDAIRAERQRWREDVGARKPALEVNVHRAFSNFIRKLMWLQPGGSRCVRYRFITADGLSCFTPTSFHDKLMVPGRADFR
jgi:hypothetical protein